MINPSDLLQVAEELAVGATPAHWRRSVSTAYYAVFQLFSFEAATLVDCGARLRHTLHGAIDHATLRDISKALAPGRNRDEGKKLREALFENEVPDRMQELCRLVLQLYEARRSADYDPAYKTTTPTSQELVQHARDVFKYWAILRDDEAGRIFLVALLAAINKPKAPGRV